MVFEPCKIMNKHDIVKVCFNESHLVFLDVYGCVYTMGDNK